MFVFFLCFDAGQWYGFSERVTKLHCSEPVELEVTIKVAFCTNFVKCYWTTPLLVGFYWIWTNFCRVAIASTWKWKKHSLKSLRKKTYNPSHLFWKNKTEKFSFPKLRQPSGQRLSSVRTQQTKISIRPILFLCYEASLVSSNLNSKQLRFYGVRYISSWSHWL